MDNRSQLKAPKGEDGAREMMTRVTGTLDYECTLNDNDDDHRGYRYEQKGLSFFATSNLDLGGQIYIFLHLIPTNYRGWKRAPTLKVTKRHIKVVGLFTLPTPKEQLEWRDITRNANPAL